MLGIYTVAGYPDSLGYRVLPRRVVHENCLFLKKLQVGTFGYGGESGSKGGSQFRYQKHSYCTRYDTYIVVGVTAALFNFSSLSEYPVGARCGAFSVGASGSLS